MSISRNKFNLLALQETKLHSSITVETEYIAVESCCAQVLWIKQQLKDYGMSQIKIPIKCDNTSAINLSKNPIQHFRSKHIEIRHHFIREHVQNKDIILNYVGTEK